jgi:uncharacterized protein
MGPAPVSWWKDGDLGRAALATGIAVGYGAVAPRVLRASPVLPNVAMATLGVVAARHAGRSWDDLGLDPGHAVRGLRHGATSVAPIAIAVAALAAVPKLRRFLHDDRVVEPSHSETAFDVVVRIPFETALAEEVLFRGVLLGLTTAAVGRTRAIAWTSLAFGVWHTAPALRAHESNPHGAALAERYGGAAATIAGTVAATAAAGAALALLRFRARSVVAPVIAHAALNVAAVLAARTVHRTRGAGARL